MYRIVCMRALLRLCSGAGSLIVRQSALCMRTLHKCAGHASKPKGHALWTYGTVFLQQS